MLEELLDTDHEVVWGQTQQLTPLIRRVTANNPGVFTFRGTGTYIVGRGKVAVIDPGPDNANHLNALLNAVRGEEVTHIVITHTHVDHSPGAKALQEATGAVTFGFGAHPGGEERVAKQSTNAQESHGPTNIEPTNNEPTNNAQANNALANNGQTSNEQTSDRRASDTERSGDTHFMPDEVLRDGDTIAGGANTWTLDCLHTPGHLSNHLCFALREEQALFTGDHVMGWSTTVIPQPHGNLGDYLHSLQKLLPRNDRTYWPTHGPPVDNPQNFTVALIHHRQHRTNQILKFIKTSPKTIPELVAEIYADKPKELHKPATQTTLAHLNYLLETDQIVDELLEGGASGEEESVVYRLI